jgi:hypothetical protein
MEDSHRMEVLHQVSSRYMEINAGTKLNQAGFIVHMEELCQHLDFLGKHTKRIPQTIMAMWPRKERKTRRKKRKAAIKKRCYSELPVGLLLEAYWQLLSVSLFYADTFFQILSNPGL